MVLILHKQYAFQHLEIEYYSYFLFSFEKRVLYTVKSLFIDDLSKKGRLYL